MVRSRARARDTPPSGQNVFRGVDVAVVSTPALTTHPLPKNWAAAPLLAQLSPRGQRVPALP